MASRTTAADAPSGDDLSPPPRLGRSLGAVIRSPDLGIALGIFLLALIPRLSAVWQGFITPDEPIWVFRSIRFLQALEAHRWAETFQMGHPGVLTMWMGALGIWWQRWRDAAATVAHVEWISNVAWVTPDNGELFRHLAGFLPPARTAMAALNALGVAGTYLLGQRLWHRRLALVGAALLALDPFVTGFSGLLHVDAPAMTFTFLSLLSWLLALDRANSAGAPGQPPARLWHSGLYALLSGFCAGLGVLSKSPTIFLIVSAVVSVALFLLFAPSRSWRQLSRIALLALPWLVGAVAALFGAFPAMWSDPLGVLQRIYGLADRHLDMPHRISFFRGIGGGDPGPVFYPVVLLFRLTPITLIGLALSVISFFESAKALKGSGGDRFAGGGRRRAVLASLWAFVIGFTAFVTMGAKKFDRYLLPVFPVLDLLAAVGWVSAIRWFCALWRKASAGRVTTTAFVAGVFVLMVAQAATILTGWPYYLDVYNPLAGGMKGALHTLPVGWGEGVERIADSLNRQPDAAERVVAGASPVTLGPLFEGTVVALSESSRWLADDLLVTAIDRQIYPERVLELTDGARLAQTVRVGGQEVLWLYATHHTAEAEHLDSYGAPGDAILCDAASPFARHTPNVQLIQDESETDVVRLLNEWTASHTRLWYMSYPGASQITAAYVHHQLQEHAVQLDQVDLEYVSATLYILPEEPVFRAVDPPSDGSLTETASFRPVQFGAEITIATGILLEETHTTQSGVAFRLRWQATGTPGVDVSPFVHLLDERGHLRTAGRGEELLVDERYWPTSKWLRGDSVERDYHLNFPPGLPPGRYWLAVGLQDGASGGRLPLLDEQGAVVGTTASLVLLDVLPHEVPDTVNMPNLRYASDITWGLELRLTGYDHPSRSTAGATAVVELGWLGIEAPSDDYAVRIGLTSSTGAAHEQVFPLSTFATSRWRAGETVHELYDLHLSPDLMGGDYALFLQVLDSDGSPLADPASLGAMSIATQDRTFVLPQPPQTPLDFRLGEAISLLGYDLPQTTTRVGAELSLTLYWRCEAPMDTSYTVFVHLLDPNGEVRGQQDLLPQNGRAPTSGWVTGQIVVDEYAIPVSEEAQPGAYRVEVGMYRAEDVVRLRIVDDQGTRLAGDRILLEQEIAVAK